MIKVILATGSDEVNSFISQYKENVVVLGEVSSKKQLLRHTEQSSTHDLIILSTLISGDENLLEVIFKIMNKKECRFIILAQSSNEAILEELFYLGIRDFIFDPISPHYLLERISSPASFKEAVQVLNTNKPTIRFKRKFKKLLQNEDPGKSHISKEAKSIIAGVTKLLQLEEKENLEDTLFELEKKIVEIALQ